MQQGEAIENLKQARDEAYQQVDDAADAVRKAAEKMLSGGETIEAIVRSVDDYRRADAWLSWVISVGTDQSKIYRSQDKVSSNGSH